MIPMNDLHRAFDEQREELEAALLDVARSGWYVNGKYHAQFESLLASHVGVQHCIGVGNGTDALELCLRALVTHPQRRVVVSAANAGGYTTAAARSAGLDIRYSDVDPETLCLTAETVEKQLSDEVGAVVVTHLYGRLAPAESLAKLCRGWGVPLVEDCAQALGASRNDQRAGSFGTASAFSFYPTKNLGALGDAGAIATNDEALAVRIRSMRQYGWSEKYVVSQRGGRNSRLDEVQAAALVVRLPRLDDWNDRRRFIVGRYTEASATSPLRLLRVNGADHVAHLAVARCIDREQARLTLAEAGVQTEVHFPVPDHLQTEQSLRKPPHLPITERASKEVLSLPCFPQMTDQEIDVVCEAIRRL